MSGLWAGFAHHNRPTATDVPTWPAYTPKTRTSDQRALKDPFGTLNVSKDPFAT